MNSTEVLLIVPRLEPRRLLLAQLLEEGFDVVPADNWPGPRPWPRPRLVVIDLDGLSNAADALRDLRGVMPADRVIVMTTLDGPAERDLRDLGFLHVMPRPLSIGDVASEVKRRLS
jgi:hypothetical protein